MFPRQVGVAFNVLGLSVIDTYARVRARAITRTRTHAHAHAHIISHVIVYRHYT